MISVNKGTFLLTLARVLFVGWTCGKDILEYTYSEPQIFVYFVVLAITGAFWCYDHFRCQGSTGHPDYSKVKDWLNGQVQCKLHKMQEAFEHFENMKTEGVQIIGIKEDLNKNR